MYDIVDYVYGVEYNQRIASALAVNCEFPEDYPDGADTDIKNMDYDELEDYGFEFMYSGHADVTPGYFGVVLHGCPSWEIENKEWQPTEDQKEEYRNLYAGLPDWLKEVIPAEPTVVLVWSTS